MSDQQTKPASVHQAAVSELELLASKASQIANQLRSGGQHPQNEVAGVIVQAARMRSRLVRIDGRLRR